MAAEPYFNSSPANTTLRASTTSITILPIPSAFYTLIPVLWLFCPSSGAAAGISFSDLSAEAKADHVLAVSDSIVRANLGRLDADFLDYRLDDAVRRRIVNYLENWSDASGRLLARSTRYFPIFEEQLAAAGMPLALKYVAVQESALRPYALSHAGAGGLWQLMPGTARELGLTVNDELDERLDAELGCAAGLQYLRYQYERYEDWGLAIAAYNCGPGNVNRAIRRSGKRKPNFYNIRRYLPRETRRYLPNIVAATYLMAFFQHHDVAVAPLPLDLQITEAVTVYRRLSLYRVAQITGLAPEVVVELNPQYLRGYLPGMPGGHRLRLPRRVMPAFQHYLAEHPAEEAETDYFPPWSTPMLDDYDRETDAYYTQYVTTITNLDTSLRRVATLYGVPADRLAVWSRAGVYDSLAVGTPITFYRVKRYRPDDPLERESLTAVSPLVNLPRPAAAIPRRRSLLLDPPLAPRLRRGITTVAPAVPPKKMSLTERILSWFD